MPVYIVTDSNGRDLRVTAATARVNERGDLHFVNEGNDIIATFPTKEWTRYGEEGVIARARPRAKGQGSA